MFLSHRPLFWVSTCHLGANIAPQNSSYRFILATTLHYYLMGVQKFVSGGFAPRTPPVGIPTKGGASPPQKPNQVQALSWACLSRAVALRKKKSHKTLWRR